MKKIIKDRFIMTVTIGPKGQIVIPKIARDMFDWNVGDTIVMLGDKKKGLAIISQDKFFKDRGI